MRNFNEGNRVAMKEVYNYFRLPLFYFAGKLIDNGQECEEIVQDSFLKLFAKRSEFETLPDIKDFLYQTTNDACIEWIRKKNADPNGLGRIVSISDNVQAYNVSGSASDEPFWKATQTELLIKIQAQIEMLPTQCRKIFKMHFYENKRVAEISNKLQITQTSVSAQLRIATHKLRLYLQIFDAGSGNIIPIESQYLNNSDLLKKPETKIEIVRYSPSFGILEKILKGKLIDDLNWREFEKLVAQLLESDGFNIELMQGTKDGGVDIVATKLHDISGYYKTVWQAKKYSTNKVSINTIRELADSVNEFKASKGIIVTSTFLTKDALYRVERDKYILSKVDRVDLDNWINQVLYRK